jgi:cell division septation protein DedD
MPRAATGFRLLALGALMLLAACGGQGRNQAQVAQDYARHSRFYAPPGPAHDPWGPYIQQAAREFDVPERWIREVMRVESGGRQDAVSPVGAMGLVQVMPATYEELRTRYDLGADPFHPRDNIRAGTAYMREMYDRFGAPGFLAAYNAGPRGLERWLYEGRALPAETRSYVAMIAPRIRGIHPERRTAPENIAMVPETIAPGPRFPPRRGAPVMLARAQQPARGPQLAAAPAPSARPAAVQPATVMIGGAPSAPSRFSLIGSAHAAPVLRPSGGPSRWAVQVGAFASESLARSTAADAKRKSRDLSGGLAFVVPTEASRNRLWRARVGGLSREDATDACATLRAQRWQCTILSPDAQ